MRTSTPTDLHPDLTMAELLQAYPGAQRAMFVKYHIGGCSSCGFRPEETLAEVCQRNQNLPVAEVLEYLDQARREDEKIQIDPRDLQQKLRKNEDLEVIDIRTREEWEVGKIPGARLFSQEMMQEMLGQWPKEKLLVFYDHQGARSMDAAAFFAGHGFQNVRSLRGGIDAWSVEVDPEIPRYELE